MAFFSRALVQQERIWGGAMMTFALGRPLIFLCFLPLLLAPCHARDCKTETASALLQAAVGSGHGCSEKAEVKVCARRPERR